MRWRAYELQCREGGGGKKQKTKFSHDGEDPRQIIGNMVWRSANKRWAGLWQPAKAGGFLFLNMQTPDARLFIAHSGHGFKP
jgi:hypothetical protein